MFNAQNLLNPIAESQNPCGKALIFAPEIDQISEARREEDPTLDQGEWVTEVKVAAWPTVIDLCTKLINNKSKDLRFAVWLTEAGAKAHHFAGLNEGYQVILGLIEQYWDDFYPQMNDEDGLDQRVGNLSWILSRSITLIKNMPLTEGKNSAYTSIDYEVARKNSTGAAIIPDANAQQGALNLATIESARKKSSPAFYKTLLQDVTACQASIAQLETAVDEKLGIEGPSFAPCKEAISVIVDLVKRFAQEAGVISSNQTQAKEANQEQPLTNNASHGMQNEYINNRNQALMQLRQVADFFRRTEPHSPVAYLADKAAHWGEMPLHQWLSTVIKDPNSLSHVEELLGLASKPPAAAEEA